MSAPTGLRERKKQKTRDTIERVALELFAERGYEQTTLAEIAEAAEVSTRTIFSYFPSKEDIVFCGIGEARQALAQALEQRPAGTGALDTVHSFFAGAAFESDPLKKLRRRIITSDEALRSQERAQIGPIQKVIADAIADDLDVVEDDIRPQIVAASLTAAVIAVRDRVEDRQAEAMTQEQAAAIMDQVMIFLRGGLEALKGT